MTIEAKEKTTLRELREENGLTQKELGDTFGMTYQGIQKWEYKGLGRTKPVVKLGIAAFFGVSPEEVDWEHGTKI